MWKTVALNNVNTKYEVSNEGQVRNSYTLQILKPKIKKNGYIEYCIYPEPGIKAYVLAHRLVANAFIPNPNNLSTVNHIDGNKTNNSIDNLEWASYKENAKHAWAHSLNNSLESNKPVLQYSLQGIFIQEYSSCAEATRQTKIKHVHDVAKGTRKSAGGYIWKFKENVPLRSIGKEIKVAQYDLQNNLISVYNSISQASKETHINRKSINDCVNNKIKTAGNYIWKKYKKI